MFIELENRVTKRFAWKMWSPQHFFLSLSDGVCSNVLVSRFDKLTIEAIRFVTQVGRIRSSDVEIEDA